MNEEKKPGEGKLFDIKKSKSDEKESAASNAVNDTGDENARGVTSQAEISYDPVIFEKTEDIAEGLNFAPDDGDLPAEFDAVDTSLAFYDLSAKEEEKPKVKKKIKYKVIKERGGSVRSIAFTVSYIAAVLVCSVVLGYFIVIFMNDVFAFSKDNSDVPITITGENYTVDQLAEMLHKEGIIEYPFLFKLYVKVKYDNEITVKEGAYILSPSFNYDKIINALNPAPKRTEITLTFKEGITTEEIINIFVSNGIGTKERFEEVIAEGDFDYWFLTDLEDSEERYYRLDGYLYPDTYRFYSDSTEEEALKKLLSNFGKKLGEEYKERIDQLGLTVDQTVIIASMIQTEAYWVSDYPFVSAVFHNRLNSTTFNGKFDSDATIQYVLAHEYGGRHEELTAADLAIDSPYNTRLYEGFPPGPICSPSINALKAALYPDEDCGYYYFVTDNEFYCRFAKTQKEHDKNIEDIRKEKED